jgi:hypothetical protein
VHVLIPEIESAHAMSTVTFVLFQPCPLGAGARLALIEGASLSSLITTEPFPALPRRSDAAADFVTPVVFEVTLSVAGVGPLATPEPESLADHVIVTFESRQPAAFAAGVMLDAVTLGPVLSRTYEALLVAVLVVQCPFGLTFSPAVMFTCRRPSQIGRAHV